MDKKKAASLTKRRHPLYQAMLEHWVFLATTYEGGRAWFKKNLFRYHKEGSSEFQDRTKRAYRFNHSREVVDLVNKYLFRGEINRSKDASEALKAFWQKATLAGLSMDEFARVMSLQSSIYGRAWVVIDNSLEVDGDGKDLTEADVEAADSQIYAYIVTPDNVLDWSADRSGELNWVLIRESFRDDKDPFGETGKNDTLYRYRLWMRDEWVLVTPKGKARNQSFDVKSGKHDLGVVPVVPVDNQITGDGDAAPSLIADIAYLDRASANYVSNLDAIIQDQTFSQLTMPAQNILPGDEGYDQMIEAGTKRIFTYDSAAGGKPEFISPDPRQAQLIVTAINKIIAEIYNSVGLAGENTKQDNAQGIDNSSGVAKSKDFERVNALLISKADALELAENRICKIVKLWAGEKDEDNSDGVVQYSDSFDVLSMFDEIYVLAQLSVANMPAEVQREQMRRIVDKLFPYIDEKSKKKMLKEIDEWEPGSEPAPIPSAESKDRMAEEAKRNRTASGEMQSKSKSVSDTPETASVTE